MKKGINYLLGILLSVTLFLIVICFTLLNNNYVKHYFEKNDYYSELYKETNEYEDKSEFKFFMNKYIDSKYTYDMNNNSFSKYVNKLHVRRYTYIIYISTLVMIYITGTVLNKTKKKHDINCVFMIGSIISIFIYGIIYIFNNISNSIVNNLINISDHYLLGLSIILLELSILKLITNKCVKK